jgi:hypothetical protein
MTTRNDADAWRVADVSVESPDHFLPSLSPSQRGYAIVGVNASGKPVCAILAGLPRVAQADPSILYLIGTGQESRHVDLDELLPHVLKYAEAECYTGVATSYRGSLDNQALWSLGWMVSTRFPGWEYLGRDTMSRLVELKLRHRSIPR